VTGRPCERAHVDELLARPIRAPTTTKAIGAKPNNGGGPDEAVKPSAVSIPPTIPPPSTRVIVRSEESPKPPTKNRADQLRCWCPSPLAPCGRLPCRHQAGHARR